jgi:glycosyltransferase involved in cell wall biosynthesis
VTAESPRVLHLSLSDLEGGAARAAYRTHRALLAAGHPSRMLVRSKVSGDPAVEIVDPPPRWESRRRRVARRLPLRNRLPEPTATFNFDLPQDFDERSLFRHVGEVDVLCLHRITRFLTVRQIRALHERYACALVWIVLDQSPVTGGCHYSLGCEGYTQRCGNCPQLRSADPDDASRTLWLRKQRDLADLPLTFVTPSSDTERWVRRSSLFGEHPVERIALPIDADVFRPIDQAVARTVLRLPPDRKIVFVGAADLGAARKGAAHAVAALKRVRELRREDDVFVLVAGSGADEFLREVTLPGRAIGRLADDVALALAYQAADVFLSPSVADAGPMMVPEALLCGRPVVAFDIGYTSDLVTAPGTGYRAALGDADDLASGLAKVLADDDGERVARECRKAAAAFDARRVAAAHADLYRRLVGEVTAAAAAAKEPRPARAAGVRSTGAPR